MFYCTTNQPKNKEKAMKAQARNTLEGKVIYDLPQGLSQPAQRALAGADIQSLAQLTKFSQAEIKQLHGKRPVVC